jgi:hypothetical protein
MASKKRIFISFAIEDSYYRHFLVGQSLHRGSPFEFVDMSVKQPWENSWKTNCRTKIKGCDGTIALISKNTAKADGQLWEIKCSNKEGVPVRGVYVTTDNRPATLPSELFGVKVVGWTWPNIANFIDSL